MVAGYLLDTNIVSETRKRRPHGGVTKFLDGCDPAQLFLSVLTIGELHKGVAARRRGDADGAAQLAAWVERIERIFADRVLPVDVAVARLWGEFSAEKTVPVVDTLIAATAITHDLVLVTRNVRDVRATRVVAVNPWQSAD